jgi:acyl-CoA synthetase (AMP-forming)/AMP-acid ligase II
MPEPGQPGHQRCLEQLLIDMCVASQGRALVLFTSHSALRSTYRVLQPILEERGILVLGHAIDGSRRRILNQFKQNTHAVLLGTTSFWEGIDVIGDALSLLVITKLPFSVPTDPVFAARAEQFDDGFEQYSVPQAILRFKQGFGMTEFGPGIFALAPEDAIRKAGSIGRPNFYVDAQIVDDGNHFLGPNEPGELVLKGPSYCSGYFNNPQATKDAVDERGFFHTGDLAYFDDEGYFHIVDRKKDMFISGGENVYPAEIDKVLYQHPAVHMCAVIGLPDEAWGDRVVACVVRRDETEGACDEASLRSFVRERLAPYKVPKDILFLAELPKNALGKVVKPALSAQIRGRVTGV